MSNLKDRLNAVKQAEQAENVADQTGIWTPDAGGNSKIFEMQHGAAKVGFAMEPFWGFATGSSGAKIRLYAPTAILVCITIMAAFGAAR